MVREPKTAGSKGKCPASQPDPERRTSLNLGPELEEVTHDEFMEMIHEKPSWVYERLMEHMEQNELSEQQEHAGEVLKNQALQGELLTLQKDLAEMKHKLEQAQETVHQDVPVRKQRTAKIPDPPMLTDGKEPRFDDWLLLMDQKLEANADHYDSPQLRRAYVASRCDGKARKHITPRLRTEAANRYDDSNDMINHLKTIYDDPNRVTIAKNQFRSLYMKTSDKFHDFLSEFLYLAAEAGVVEEDWKDELYHRLTTELQKLTMTEKIKDGSFNDFSSACSQTANSLEIINHRAQKNRSFTSNRDSRLKDATSSSLPSTPIKKEESNDNQSQLMRQGKCFTCFQHGHVSRNCPRKKLLDTEVKNLEKDNDVAMGSLIDGQDEPKNV